MILLYDSNKENVNIADQPFGSLFFQVNDLSDLYLLQNLLTAQLTKKNLFLFAGKNIGSISRDRNL